MNLIKSRIPGLIMRGVVAHFSMFGLSEQLLSRSHRRFTEDAQSKRHQIHMFEKTKLPLPTFSRIRYERSALERSRRTIRRTRAYSLVDDSFNQKQPGNAKEDGRRRREGRKAQ